MMEMKFNLPLLPLRDIVVFPNMVIPLFVGRDKSINALNEVIKSLNNGVLDKSFTVNWNDYRNCILLIQTEGFNRIDTKIKEIINL